MATNLLFVFEGRSSEELITNSLFKYLLTENQIIKCVFDAEIYQLYRKIGGDEYLDIFNFIKNKNENNKSLLKNYDRDDFAEIYMFFDYDAHSTLADDETLKDMLEFFNDETNNGKLYISYPMVEAIRHIVDFDTFKELTAKCKRNNCMHKEKCEDKIECLTSPHYKNVVSNESIPQLSNINGYTRDTWKDLIAVHLSKMNYIVNDEYKFPSKLESQLEIFINQLLKYVNKQCPSVAILSAFPIFIIDYYGVTRTRGLIY